MKRLTNILALVTLLFLTTAANAEQKQVFGDYEVHYIALPTTVLDPAIAKQYNLVRSKSTGFLNISVLKKQPDGTTRAISAFIRGHVRNLVQQQRELEFSRVSEGSAVYQIAQFWYSEGENMVFELEVQADPEQGPFSLRFSQSLYPE
ncbi:DUF4426 domain-containing protein [Hahella ganghwensis]|uniref:DUF4426 domain-containing protein n=1 Tax=Hahella ganghwensis TaxID=286420 RepID=UPI00037A18C9|nr:DUF4426 domain-containing protein [Hahella ganghwensis]